MSDAFAVPDPPAPARRTGRRRAVFLDKDGTLVDALPGSLDRALMRFTPNAPDALQRLSQAGWLLVIVSHQPGAAAGGGADDEFGLLAERVRTEAGTALAGFYCCQHPAAEGGERCNCGQTDIAVFETAARELDIDLSASWMVGDILDDVEVGRRAGCRTVFVDRGNECEWRLSPWRIPHHSCGDLRQAAAVILATTAG